MGKSAKAVMRETDRQTNRLAERQADRQTCTHRQTDRRTEWAKEEEGEGRGRRRGCRRRRCGNGRAVPGRSECRGPGSVCNCGYYPTRRGHRGTSYGPGSLFHVVAVQVMLVCACGTRLACGFRAREGGRGAVEGGGWGWGGGGISLPRTAPCYGQRSHAG